MTVKINRAVISYILPYSIADEIGFEPGDTLIKINEMEINDIIDYKYLMVDSDISVEVEKHTGEKLIADIEKDIDEDIGIYFNNDLFDGIKTCQNNCIFCFVDNLPGNLRDSLYVKDDDYRSSFLHGNFITLTNLKKKDYDRIVDLNLSPLYISVHTTDSKLRKKLLVSSNAGNIMEQLKYFKDHNINFHAQIVLCPEINDGIYLENTINDLQSFYPNILSLGIVPVGLTKFNENSKLRTFNEGEIKKIIYYIENKQREFLRTIGTRLIFLADEFYLKSGLKLPEDHEYEEYYQIENGIGLTRNFINEFKNSLPKTYIKRKKSLEAVVLTGRASKEIMVQLLSLTKKLIGNIEIEVISVDNNFFGGEVTVTGLLTGSDLQRIIQDINKSKEIIIPDIMFKKGSYDLLDGQNINEIASEHGHKIKVLPTNGEVMVGYLKGEEGFVDETYSNNCWPS